MTVNVKDFGAVGDDTTDDTVAIQNAINSLGAQGGTVYFPTGVYLVSNKNRDHPSLCLEVTYPIHLVGDGPFYTAIKPNATLPSDVDTIRFYPSSAIEERFTSIERLFLGNPNNGTRAGRHGVYCLTLQPGQNLPSFRMRDVFVAQGSGHAFHHLNDYVQNVNGGLYAALLEGCVFAGGLWLENSGDSNVIRNNLISASGDGVYATLTTGASLLSILDNNITSAGSAIKIDAGSRFHILRNNCEQTVAGARACFDINGANGTMVAGVIGQNLVSAFGQSTVRCLIRLSNCIGLHVADNALLAGRAGIVGIQVEANNNSVRIGANSYNASVIAAGKVVDLGVGTAGVVKVVPPAALQNGWTHHGAPYAPVSYVKDGDGFVMLDGVMTGGVTTPGTLLFRLPELFRPAGDELFTTTSWTGASFEQGVVTVRRSGAVTIERGSSRRFSVSGIRFRAEGGSDGVSFE